MNIQIYLKMQYGVRPYETVDVLSVILLSVFSIDEINISFLELIIFDIPRPSPQYTIVPYLQRSTIVACFCELSDLTSVPRRHIIFIYAACARVSFAGNCVSRGSARYCRLKSNLIK